AKVDPQRLVEEVAKAVENDAAAVDLDAAQAVRSVADDNHRPGVDRGAGKTLHESRRLVAGVGRLVRVDRDNHDAGITPRRTDRLEDLALVGRIDDEVHAGAFTLLNRGAGHLELALAGLWIRSRRRRLAQRPKRRGVNGDVGGVPERIDAGASLDLAA